MWALVEDNAITKIINNPKGLVIGDTRYSKNIFSFRWTNEEREAIGIYEVKFDNSVSACFLTISFLIVFNPLVVTPSIVTSSISFPVSLQ